MNLKTFPFLLLALAGCRESATPVAAQNQIPVPAPIKVETALDKYLARPETAYKWAEITDGEFAPGDGDANLRLTSQTWQGKPWTHRLQIFRPKNLKYPDAAILNIAFGSGSTSDTFIGKAIADATGALVVNVFNVPNQPLFDRREDELIAYTFAKFLETGDETWPLLFPMTKSVTKAMDTLQDWSAKEGGAQKINRFIVTGASKRGWTTYLTAASDERVVGAVPIVYNLDLPRQIALQREVWQETSPLMAPYAQAKLFDQMQAERGKRLIEMTDPWTVRARLTVPKLLINATNDRWWPVDSVDIYRAGLPGQTDVFYVPNAPHALGEGAGTALGSGAAWSRLVLDGKTAPKLELKVENVAQGRTFSIRTDGAPRIVRLWLASSPSQDFRNATWKSIELEPRDGLYRAVVTDAQLFAQGKYAQAFGEIEISAQPLPLRLSSELWQSQKTERLP